MFLRTIFESFCNYFPVNKMWLIFEDVLTFSRLLSFSRSNNCSEGNRLKNMVFRFTCNAIIGKIEKFVNLRVNFLTNYIALSFFCICLPQRLISKCKLKVNVLKTIFFPWLIHFTATKMTYKVASEILMVFKFGTSPEFFFY